MFVASQLGPWLDGWNATHRRLRATQKLAATAVAVHLYRTDHNGALPAKLDDVAPEYLPAVPIDPNDGAHLPIRYRADAAGGAILWITGKDGTDEGGKDRPAGTSRMDYRVKFDDVVRFQSVLR
jgi:hypothetical protein